MRDSRVALAQFAPRLGDLAANLETHLATSADAAAQGADVVVFPELSLTGYLLRDHAADCAIRSGDQAWDALLDASRAIDLVVGFVEHGEGHRFYNAGAYFSGGELVHLHRKLYLPTYGMFLEGREFARGERLRRFDSRFGPAGMLVCEDHWHPTSPWLLAQDGAETIFTLSSSPTRGARPGKAVTSVAVWRQLLQVSAQFHTSYMVYVNRCGNEDGLTFGGGSMVVDPFGRVVAELPPLESGMALVELQDEVLRRARTAYPLLRDERLNLVQRELDRVRRRRYDLADPEPGDETEEPPAESR